LAEKYTNNINLHIDAVFGQRKFWDAAPSEY
jgi:hypothetical protein